MELFQIAARIGLKEGLKIQDFQASIDSFEYFTTLCNNFAEAENAQSRIEKLTPIKKEDASSTASLSAQYGLDVFPAHIDGSHTISPPRLISLYCETDEQNRPTILYEWSKIISKLTLPERLFREVFLIKNGRNSFYDSILSPSRGFVRFDPGCMIPATIGADKLMQDIIHSINNSEKILIHWSQGLGLFINNWKFLHGRGLPTQEGSRVLYRATFQ